jgi:hypothetical protein
MQQQYAVAKGLRIHASETRSQENEGKLPSNPDRSFLRRCEPGGIELKNCRIHSASGSMENSDWGEKPEL